MTGTRQGARAAAVLVALAALASCGDDSGSGPGGPDGGGGLTLETGARVSAEVGGGGDTLTTASSAGARYTLGIAGGALIRATDISLTPVAAAGSSPIAEAGLVAAVRMEPSGTVFGAPAELTIELPAGTSTAGLAGFLAEGDGAAPHLVPIVVEGTKVTLLVPHFSVAGVVRDASNIPPPPASAAAASAQHALAQHLASLNGGPPDTQTLFAIFDGWYQSVVRPKLTTAAAVGATDEQAVDALAEADLWVESQLQVVQLFIDDLSVVQPAFSQLVPRNEERSALVVDVLAAGIARANAQCLAQPASNEGLVEALQAASNALFWHTVARNSLFPVPPALDLATVLAGLCFQVSYDNVVFPLELTVGQTVPFQVRVGLERGGVVDFAPGLLEVEVQPAGATVAPGQPTTFFTDPDGFFDTQLSVSQPAVVVNVHSCGSLAFGTYLPLLCRDTVVVRNPVPPGSFAGGYDGVQVFRQKGDPTPTSFSGVRWFLNPTSTSGVDFNLVFAGLTRFGSTDRQCRQALTCFRPLLRTGNTFSGTIGSGEEAFTITGSVTGDQLTFVIDVPKGCVLNFDAPAGCTYEFTGTLTVPIAR